MIRICAIVYLAVLIFVLLQPFQFFWPFGLILNSAESRGQSGVAFGKSGMLISASKPDALYQAFQAGKGLSIELWLKTGSDNQNGPSRIVSYSLDPWHRNFTISQTGQGVNVRLRTTESDSNGNPSIDFPRVFDQRTLQHIVVTYDFAQTRLYVDGQLRAANNLVSEGFDTWSPNHFLVFGNEASGARPWNGTLSLAAIYDVALPASAVARRYFNRAALVRSPLLEYDFSKSQGKSGAEGQVSGTIEVKPDLTRPERVAEFARPIFLFFDGRLTVSELNYPDIIGNIILFLPFGILGVIVLQTWGRTSAYASIMVVFAAAVVSVACETIQIFEMTRTSSFLDVATNLIGASVGAAAARNFILPTIETPS